MIISKISDPRNKVITYYESVNSHILDGHNELIDFLPQLPIDVILNPDWIREGRTDNTEMYFKIDSIDGCTFSGTIVTTKDIFKEGELQETIMTTAFTGKDKTNSKIKWSKTKGNIE